jgi:mono/diheme cytochrome c family protein
MADHSTTSDLDVDVAEHQDVAFEPRLVGVVAEFGEPEKLLESAAAVRDAGFTRWDTYTPFPVHGIDVAMGIRRTVLPWLVLIGGLTGTTVAIGLQYYTNASREIEYAVGWPFSGYQYPISGKPYWSLPANIPIAFELTVLLASFAGFLGMIALNRLVRWYNPMFKIERFRHVTDDRFFLAIDAGDPKFNAQELPGLLRGLGATAVDECWDDEPRRLPAGFATAGLVLFALALVPPALIMHHRSVNWATPELHLIQDMDFQMKFKSQQRNPFFADERAMRPQVEGTVARGQFSDETSYDRFYRGIEAGQAMASLQQNGNAQSGDAKAAGDIAGQEKAPASGTGKPGSETRQAEAEAGKTGPTPPAGKPAAGMDENQNWTEVVPIAVDADVIQVGKQKFEIYCAPCHGLAGYGDGLVNARAQALKAPTWVPVASLHTPVARKRPDGYIFRAITEGVRKMPAYGSQIHPEDRWAIVVYVRALQRSQGAPSADSSKP